MKVIIVSDYAMVNGGAGKIALESACALADIVDEVTVFTAIGEPAHFLLERENLKVISLGQKPVTAQSYKNSIIGGLWNKEAQRRFAKLLDGAGGSATFALEFDAKGLTCVQLYAEGYA